MLGFKGLRWNLLTVLCCAEQIHSWGSTRSDPALLDGTSRPKQWEHCWLQQQEVLATRCSHATDETRCQPVSCILDFNIFPTLTSYIGMLAFPIKYEYHTTSYIQSVLWTNRRHACMHTWSFSDFCTDPLVKFAFKMMCHNCLHYTCWSCWICLLGVCKRMMHFHIALQQRLALCQVKCCSEQFWYYFVTEISIYHQPFQAHWCHMITGQSVQGHTDLTLPFLIFWHSGTLALSPELQSAQMSKI